MREIKFRFFGKNSKKIIYTNVYTSNDLEKNNFLEVMQYTGLKDKNGKEIYEGDILKYTYDEDDISFSTIKSVMVESCGCCNSVFGWEIPKNIHDCEIVGNIYENPELLEL